MAITPNISTIDLIFRDQAYHHLQYSIQSLIKSAFDRIHQIVVKCALCYSLIKTVFNPNISHTIDSILQV